MSRVQRFRGPGNGGKYGVARSVQVFVFCKLSQKYTEKFVPSDFCLSQLHGGHSSLNCDFKITPRTSVDREMLSQAQVQPPNSLSLTDELPVFRAEWDEKGVYFYQCFNDEIADWALAHQTLGGPAFKPLRMTWIKPSFAWALYRSGYGRKHNQNRILKLKLSHDSVAALLSKCECKEGGGGTKGRVQWDPERDMHSGEGYNIPSISVSVTVIIRTSSS